MPLSHAIDQDRTRCDLLRPTALPSGLPSNRVTAVALVSHHAGHVHPG